MNLLNTYLNVGLNNRAAMNSHMAVHFQSIIAGTSSPLLAILQGIFKSATENPELVDFLQFGLHLEKCMLHSFYLNIFFLIYFYDRQMYSFCCSHHLRKV